MEFDYIPPPPSYSYTRTPCFDALLQSFDSQVQSTPPPPPFSLGGPAARRKETSRIAIVLPAEGGPRVSGLHPCAAGGHQADMLDEAIKQSQMFLDSTLVLMPGACCDAR